MGLFATLENTSVACPKCGEACTSDWQFYFGAVWDMPTYKIGDEIAWTAGTKFGDPSMTLVYALAYAAAEPACPACKVDCLVAEIVIRDSVITELVAPRAVAHVPELLYVGEEREPRYHKDLYR